MNIDEALANYLVQLQGDGRSNHTVDQARRHVRLFASWLDTAGHGGAIEDVRHEDLARFCASDVMLRRADGALRKPTSGNALRSSLRAFFGYVHGAGYASTNAARLVRRARCEGPRPRSLPEADSQQLLIALDGARTPAELRDRALFHTLMRVGIRVGTAVTLEVGDVNLEAAELELRSMKGNRADVAFLSHEMVKLLRDYIADRKKGPLFPAEHGRRLTSRHVQRRLTAWATMAGITRRLSPHDLRHGFAVALYSRTRDILLVREALHHRSISSTLVYAKCDQGRLRSAMG